MSRLINRMMPLYKTLTAMFYDLLMTSLCFYLALSIRYESITPWSFKNIPILKLTLITSAIQFPIFVIFGLYRGIWRFSSIPDLVRLIKGITAGVVASNLFLFFMYRLSHVPRVSIFIDWVLLIMALGGGRFSYRLFKDRTMEKTLSHENDLRVLIYGAGGTGEQLYREIRKNPHVHYNVVGFMDDDPYKSKRTLHGIPVHGGLNIIEEVVEDMEIDLIIIAMPSASSKNIKKVVEKCQELNVKIKILPKMSDVIQGDVEIAHLRNVKIEDILGRKEIQLDRESIKSIIHDKRVLISGAGGSIGSELVVQIVKYKPRELYLIDISEINLFRLERKINEMLPDNNLKFIIGDVRDKVNLEKVFQEAKPEIVLHAAAYKHVPLMEQNPMQAIRTNVFGTYNMADMAIKYDVKNFVQVSTDKAVNPTNVMGTTKRIAEIICQNFQRKSDKIHFTTVRFGNVLGSSGSVIPIFKEQILKGGPVTVTHPEIQRYFMSIPEASQLILQAATLGNGGEIFVLDMGEPVKILDLAKQLIKLANLEVGKNINIEISGLRPGEKLFEELLADKESTLPTSHPLVRTAKSTSPSKEVIQRIEDLMGMDSCDAKEIKSKLLEIVPEYDPEQNQNQVFSSKVPVSNQIH